ncbi:hypothetical protein MATL_G00121730 [Megalops atlanticus]|uniref:Uncharacterized protein n=1 Tax=Megalops atlanticus TaxID=7932 RepID=A0A9D3Q0D1_MEGAT|nr:hypothetical protein MATL_G00121730 [Megalops atlanticus]
MCTGVRQSRPLQPPTLTSSRNSASVGLRENEVFPSAIALHIPRRTTLAISTVDLYSSSEQESSIALAPFYLFGEWDVPKTQGFISRRDLNMGHQTVKRRGDTWW